ncbi:MAG: hypothetical protein J6Y94_00010, partial [Bacteriovoracaceae bacterium]|nr:hypothetical protein [Bacteriovoracaceae bacterium]
VKFVIDMDPYTKRPTAYWSKFPQSTPEIKLHLSTALFQKGHPSLNATQWAKLIEQAIKEEYNDEYLATKNLIIPPKKNFILDSRFQFWAVAKQQALKDRRPPRPDWFALPQIWWPSYHRFFKQAIRVTQEKIYTGRRADGTKVHVPMETRRLMAVGDHARYTMMVSFPKNISPANRNILLTTIQEIFSALPVEIPLTRSIKFLPENIFPYSDFTNPEEHATMAVCNFKGQQNRASSKETVYFDYHEELIIGNFISSSQTLSADKIKQKVREGLANIINNGIFKDAPQTSLPEEFFTAMIPQYRPSAYRRDDRRKAIKAISYYLEHRFNRNYEPSKHLAYQPLFNFLDKFFIAREKILPEIKQKIHLATARDSKLWEKLPLIYEEQLVPAPQKGQRNFQISLNHPGHIAPIPLQLFDLGDDTIDALDQFRDGVDYFIGKRKLSYEDFLKQLSFIKLTDASAPANAVRLTGKLDRGRPTEIAFTQEIFQGRKQIIFYLNPGMMHGYVGQAKFLLAQAWDHLLGRPASPPTQE